MSTKVIRNEQLQDRRQRRSLSLSARGTILISEIEHGLPAWRLRLRTLMPIVLPES